MIFCYCLEWGADDNTLFYLTQDELHRTNKLWKHRLGSNVDDDILVHEEDNDR